MGIERVQSALAAVARVMKHGDDKHGKNEWYKSKKDPLLKIADHQAGIDRHVKRLRMGERIDADSKELALAHIAARALMALEMDEQARLKEPKECGEPLLNKGRSRPKAVCTMTAGHDGPHWDAVNAMEWGHEDRH